jgi:hypothetical protein
MDLVRTFTRILYTYNQNPLMLLHISAVDTTCSFSMGRKFQSVLDKSKAETRRKLNFETHLSADLREAGRGPRVSRHIQEMRRQVEDAL